jgi:hypothetical protein
MRRTVFLEELIGARAEATEANARTKAANFMMIVAVICWINVDFL